MYESQNMKPPRDFPGPLTTFPVSDFLHCPSNSGLTCASLSAVRCHGHKRRTWDELQQKFGCDKRRDSKETVTWNKCEEFQGRKGSLAEKYKAWRVLISSYQSSQRWRKYSDPSLKYKHTTPTSKSPALKVKCGVVEVKYFPLNCRRVEA